MTTFKAVVVDKTEQGQSVAIRELGESDLMDGDVTVRVSHSTLNYKDGLALTGKAPVVRRLPVNRLDAPKRRELIVSAV